MRSILLAGYAVLAVLDLSASANAHDMIVVLPPDTTLGKSELLQDFAGLVERLADGDELIVYSADGPRQLAVIAPPTGPKAQNPAWRKRQLGQAFAPVLHYLEDLPAEAQLGGLPSNLMIPQSLAEIGRNLLPMLPDHRADLLLLGSWRYFDPHDVRYAIVNRSFPSDGHIRGDERETPFGTGGAEQRLAGLTVHFCGTDSEGAFATKDYEETIRRFWSLYVTAQAGHIGTFSRSLPTCFQRLESGEASGQAVYTLSGDRKIEMLHMPEPGSWAPPASTDVPGAYFLSDGVAIAHEPPTVTSGIMWIGIRWEAAADLDLYARGDGSKPWLFFAETHTAEGYFNHDYTAPTAERQFEYIAFERPVDVTKAEVMIDLFAGELSVPPKGILRVWFNGKIYEAPFELAATRGNGGVQPMTGKNWLRIDLRQVLGLPPV